MHSDKVIFHLFSAQDFPVKMSHCDGCFGFFMNSLKRFSKDVKNVAKTTKE